MPKPPAKKPFVRIEWRDAEDGPTWAAEREVLEFANQECTVESFGYLVKLTKKFAILVADRTLTGNNPGEMGRIAKVPRKMILSTTEIPLPTRETPPSVDPPPVAPPPPSDTEVP